jgi:hypothetical protein
MTLRRHHPDLVVVQFGSMTPGATWMRMGCELRAVLICCWISTPEDVRYPQRGRD